MTLGTLILWPGWFGFNGGSQPSVWSVEDAVPVANIFANTNAAAAAGVVSVALVSWLLFRRIYVPLMLNGVLAGLVSITAEPVAPGVTGALAVGGIGALVTTAAARVMERMRPLDAVGAIPVHLAAGAWGPAAVAFSNADASLATQLIGVGVIGAFTRGASLTIWTLVDAIMGARLGDSQQNRRRPVRVRSPQSQPWYLTVTAAGRDGISPRRWLGSGDSKQQPVPLPLTGRFRPVIGIIKPVGSQDSRPEKAHLVRRCCGAPAAASPPGHSSTIPMGTKP